MTGIRRFYRKLGWLGVALLVVSCADTAIFGIWLVRGQRDVIETPGPIDQKVTELGGPCMAVKQHEYVKYGPLGLGDCNVHYTNAAQTSATVTLQIFRGDTPIIVTAEAVTDGGPLASLSWRVTRSTSRAHAIGGQPSICRLLHPVRYRWRACGAPNGDLSRLIGAQAKMREAAN